MHTHTTPPLSRSDTYGISLFCQSRRNAETGSDNSTLDKSGYVLFAWRDEKSEARWDLSSFTDWEKGANWLEFTADVCNYSMPKHTRSTSLFVCQWQAKSESENIERSNCELLHVWENESSVWFMALGERSRLRFRTTSHDVFLSVARKLYSSDLTVR